MTSAVVEIRGATIVTPGGRTLFAGLTLGLSRERVALVGRNGVGKSMLLTVLAGDAEPERGEVAVTGRSVFVPQGLPGGPQSHGERRRRALDEARRSGADALFLDEPTEDLDEAGVAWLRSWLARWPGALIVASHDRRLLADFRQFFVASESGCRTFEGSLGELEDDLESRHDASEERYARGLRRLEAFEEHTVHVARRRARKKRYGRCRELDRATPKLRLNQKRDYAQVKHGRMAGIRAARLEAVRTGSKSARRALRVSLAFDVSTATVPAGGVGETLVLRGVSAVADGRALFSSIDLSVGKQRIGVVGPNGAGKSTLLDIVMGRRLPMVGTVSSDRTRIGGIAQGGADWMLDESLLDHLRAELTSASPESLARTLLPHRFPLALAERSLRTLSPGERTRAALIALSHRVPRVELLVLDEPTYSLDLVGQRAIRRVLREWRGALLVASHDREFLGALALDLTIELGGHTSRRS
jgi:ATPase subunit of ABC transporter with duplicated ATPase domains